MSTGISASFTRSENSDLADGDAGVIQAHRGTTQSPSSWKEASL